MSRIAAFAGIGAGLLTLWLAVPLAAQGQMPAPPVPGPYPLMPVPLSVAPGNAPAQPPAIGQRLAPPPGMQLPYWMQPPAAGADTAPTAMAEENAPRFAPPSPATPQRPGYGRAAAPGYFPGYAAPMQGMGGGTGVIAAPPMAGPGGYRPAPYLPVPGWGWGAPQGWGGGQ